MPGGKLQAHLVSLGRGVPPWCYPCVILRAVLGLLGDSQPAQPHARKRADGRGWLFTFKAVVPRVTCEADAWGFRLKPGCVPSLLFL